MPNITETATVLVVIMTCVVLRLNMNYVSDNLREHTLDNQEVATYDDIPALHICSQVSVVQTDSSVTEMTALCAGKGKELMVTILSCLMGISVPLLHTSLKIVCLACYRSLCPNCLVFVQSITCLAKLCHWVAGKYKVLRRCFGFTYVVIYIYIY